MKSGDGISRRPPPCSVVYYGLQCFAPHIAILSILSMVFIFNQVFDSALLGAGVGVTVAVPLAVGISALEIIVVIVQAYVFTLLSSVFIGMAINVHH